MHNHKPDSILQVAEWKARAPHRLADISRHVADGVLKDVVDELIAEV